MRAGRAVDTAGVQRQAAGPASSLGQGGRQALRSAWEKLADTFCDADQYWHVFAADLKNEVCNEIGPLSHSTTEQGVLLGVGVLFVE